MDSVIFRGLGLRLGWTRIFLEDSDSKNILILRDVIVGGIQTFFSRNLAFDTKFYPIFSMDETRVVGRPGFRTPSRARTGLIRLHAARRAKDMHRRTGNAIHVSVHICCFSLHSPCQSSALFLCPSSSKPDRFPVIWVLCSLGKSMEQSSSQLFSR